MMSNIFLLHVTLHSLYQNQVTIDDAEEDTLYQRKLIYGTTKKGKDVDVYKYLDDSLDPVAWINNIKNDNCRTEESRSKLAKVFNMADEWKQTLEQLKTAESEPTQTSIINAFYKLRWSVGYNETSSDGEQLNYVLDMMEAQHRAIAFIATYSGSDYTSKDNEVPMIVGDSLKKEWIKKQIIINNGDDDKEWLDYLDEIEFNALDEANKLIKNTEVEANSSDKLSVNMYTPKKDNVLKGEDRISQHQLLKTLVDKSWDTRLSKQNNSNLTIVESVGSVLGHLSNKIDKKVQGKYMPDMNSVVYGGPLVIHNLPKAIGTKKKDMSIEQLEDEQNYIKTYPEGFITGERKNLFNTFVKKPDIDNMQNLINKLLVWPRTKKKFDFTLDIEEDIKSLTDKHLFTYSTKELETDRRFTEDNQKKVSPQEILDGDFGPPYWNTYETLVKFVKKSPQQKDMPATTYDINSTILMPWVFARMVAMKDKDMNLQKKLPDNYINQVKYLIKYHGTIGSTMNLAIADVASTNRYGLEYNSQRSLHVPNYYHMMATLFIVYTMNAVLCFERDFGPVQDAMTTIKETNSSHANHEEMMRLWCKLFCFARN